MQQRMLILFIALFAALPGRSAFAAETDVLTGVLKKVDALTCTAPSKIIPFYSKNLVIMEDGKRASLTHRIEDYERMIAEYEDMKCDFQRKVLAGEVDKKIGYVLVDETINVSARLSGDERQHNFCSYIFSREQGQWKISHEHCSSLPDYTLLPGEDGLYYFHNPVY